MKIKFATMYFKVVKPKDKEYAIVKALDLLNIDAYTFFIPAEDAIMFESVHGSTVVFDAYSTYKEGVYKTYLKSAETEDGDYIYEYHKD